MKKVLILVLAVLPALAACKKKEAQETIPVVPVKMARAEVKTMPIQITAVGAIESYNQVDIIPRVDGQIQAINFREGSEVKKGDLLVTIDPAVYQEAVSKAQAQLQQDLSELEYDRADAQRYANLLKEGAVATADAQQHQTSFLKQQEQVNADKAALAQAQLDLGYCKLTAPVSGVTSGYLVNMGAIVSRNQTKILTLNQIKPIYVTFSVAEKYLGAIRKAHSRKPLAVTAVTSDGESKTGTLSFINNTVDPNTGMIQLKASFPNLDKDLWPGQFANATITLDEQADAVVIAANAVQPDNAGKNFVYVVGADSVVQARPVVVDRTIGNQVVISSGLAGGENIVTDGQLKLRSGFKAVESAIDLNAPAK
ncbi:MAG: efflux RND transporter periplasmic adaptor subunit [Elusimicrobiaceae bacterium]|nr:efflux RND transporter periplasmic adaptor subunit [Elusimicrobiaceae bacterium]